MNLITLQQVTHHYGIHMLLDGVTLHITDETKVGLIGVNGTGKTTLMRIIAGELQPSFGEVVHHPSVVVSMVDQDPPIPSGMTVLEAALQGGDDLCRLLLSYEKAMDRLHKHPGDGALQAEVVKLQQRMDDRQVWDLETQAKTVLQQLGLEEYHALVETLSGGQRRRIALAGALIRPSSVLILDEPTNHLDLDMIEWLENYLKIRKGALVMVTHDRYFLDRVTNTIVELEAGELTQYSGSYQHYLVEKEEMLAKEAATERRLQTLYRQELAWIKRGARARTTKQKARIGRFEQLEETLDKKKKNELEVPVLTRRLGKKVIELKGVGFSYDDQPLIKSLDLLLKPGEILGLAGPNGTGKSTLLKLIAGELEPDTGVIERGETVRLSYFRQENLELDGGQKVLEYIQEGREVVTLSKNQRITASQMLEQFLFSPEKQWTTVGSLSGGEKRRLLLLRRLMEEPNLLLLDEPTNDLDITTLTVLEDYLDHFPGTVVIASHDRYLLDRLADRMLVFKGKGNVEETGLSCSEWVATEKEAGKSNPPKKPTQEGQNRQTTNRPLKFTYKEQQEFDHIEEKIQQLEQRIMELETAMVNNATDFLYLEETGKEKKFLVKEMDCLLERWTELWEKADAIEKQTQS